jgi:hypothetical protein
VPLRLTPSNLSSDSCWLSPSLRLTRVCVRHSCLAAGKTAFPIGLIKEEGAILKCGLPCCTYGLVKPTVCVSGGGECLCVKGAAAFPFKEGLVPSLMCTICFFSIIGPNTGCMAEPPAFDAPGGKPVADMER